MVGTVKAESEIDAPAILESDVLPVNEFAIATVLHFLRCRCGSGPTFPIAIPKRLM